MAYWPELSINGDEVCFAHLEPFSFSCPALAGKKPDPLVINVKFSNHVFTEKFETGKHDDALKVMDHKAPRAFSQERYALSHNLPEMLRALPEIKVFQTATRRNYMTFRKIVEVENEEADYELFFMMKKKKQKGSHLELFVESAYPVLKAEQKKQNRQNKVRFLVLADKVFRGAKLSFASR